MGKRIKKLEKKVLPLCLSIPIFICVWYIFIVMSFNFIYHLIYTIDYTDGFTLFMLPIKFAVWFLFGFFVLMTSDSISKGFKQLKRK